MEERRCDMCGRTEAEIAAGPTGEYPGLELSRNGWWLCRHCQSVVSPVPAKEDDYYEEYELPPELQALVGKSAGTVCMILDLPKAPPYKQIIEDATILQHLSMTAWTFITARGDGSSFWESPDKGSTAIVKFDGAVQVEKNQLSG
jgi:hypothetical protein